MSNETFHHITVLLKETIRSLGSIEGTTVIDATFGGGGHTFELLKSVGDKGRVISFDRDTDAVAHGRRRFKNELDQGQLVIIDKPFSEIEAAKAHIRSDTRLSGIIADIGVSSHQIDLAERGFSFQKDGPLDMRMDSRNGETAAEYLKRVTEEELANVIYHFGEEPKSRQISKLIIRSRESNGPLETTKELADLIEKSRIYPLHTSKKHPATKTFQALRIYINDELGELKQLIHQGFELLSSGARFSIITFHSLEDRIVKDLFSEFCGKSKAPRIPKEIPLRIDELLKIQNMRARIIGDFPDTPSEDEFNLNVRARSAKLRTIEKL